MAVPKRKTSPCKRGQRRSHDKLKKLNIVFDSTTGEPKLPHRVSMQDGYYNAKQVFAPKSKIDTTVETQETAAE